MDAADRGTSVSLPFDASEAAHELAELASDKPVGVKREAKSSLLINKAAAQTPRLQNSAMKSKHVLQTKSIQQSTARGSHKSPLCGLSNSSKGLRKTRNHLNTRTAGEESRSSSVGDISKRYLGTASMYENMNFEVSNSTLRIV